MPPDEEDHEIRRNSNGRPFPGVELKIVDPETGITQPPLIPGEICLKGWTLFKGYYGMPEETRKSMDDEGFFHTGDYGWMDEKGYLYYRGRYKQMVKSGGVDRRMYPRERLNSFWRTTPISRPFRLSDFLILNGGR